MAGMTKSPRLFSSAFRTNCRPNLLPNLPRVLRSFGTAPSVNASDENVHGDNPISSVLDLNPNSSAIEHFHHFVHDDVRSGEKEHRLHVYSTKHNTHITFVQPLTPASKTVTYGFKRLSTAEQKKEVDVLLSLSTGNIGFRKAGRGSYDAAHQLAAFVLKQIQDKGMVRDHKLAIVLKGFGRGREAVSKVILGSEGSFIRPKITSVVDATKLKQGSPRSKKPRRLG